VRCLAAQLAEQVLSQLRLPYSCVSLLPSLGVPLRTVTQIVGHTVMEMTMERYGRKKAPDTVDHERGPAPQQEARLVRDEGRRDAR
jgi:hypothetical protein